MNWKDFETHIFELESNQFEMNLFSFDALELELIIMIFRHLCILMHWIGIELNLSYQIHNWIGIESKSFLSVEILNLNWNETKYLNRNNTSLHVKVMVDCPITYRVQIDSYVKIYSSSLCTLLSYITIKPCNKGYEKFTNSNIFTHLMRAFKSLIT